MPPPAFQTLQISDGRLVLSSRCMVTLKPETYLYSDVFQALLKEDVSEAALRRRQ